jgi:hypothetical protein
MVSKLCAIAILVGATLLTGCYGTYDNSQLFFNLPKVGTTEGTVLRTYGTPAFAGFAENEKIYTYKVRKNQYIILFGQYEGYDMVVTCKNGEVSSVDKVVRPRTFSLLYPTPWAEEQ